MTKRAEQPFAEEAGASGEEHVFAAQRFQFRRRDTKDVRQVAGWKSEKTFLGLARHEIDSNTPT